VFGPESDLSVRSLSSDRDLRTNLVATLDKCRTVGGQMPDIGRTGRTYRPIGGPQTGHVAGQATVLERLVADWTRVTSAAPYLQIGAVQNEA
jgi:hypothetical protein